MTDAKCCEVSASRERTDCLMSNVGRDSAIDFLDMMMSDLHDDLLPAAACAGLLHSTVHVLYLYHRSSSHITDRQIEIGERTLARTLELHKDCALDSKPFWIAYTGDCEVDRSIRHVRKVHVLSPFLSVVFGSYHVCTLRPMLIKKLKYLFHEAVLPSVFHIIEAVPE